jgi:hypothetical protein
MTSAITTPVFPETFTVHCNIGMDAILQGQPNNTESCPIALSLWSAIYFNSNYQIDYVEVNPESVTIRLTGKDDIVEYAANIPETGKNFISDFDEHTETVSDGDYDYEVQQEFRKDTYKAFEMDLNFFRQDQF